MHLTRFILKNVMRHKLRSILTVLGIAIAILAFGVIRTVISIWYSGIEASSPNRLVTRNAISLIYRLPIAYQHALAAVPGVSEITHADWFGGIYIDEKHSQFPQIAIDASTWFKVYPEYLVPDAEMAAFAGERNAAVIGPQLADRFGWKIGDIIRMRGMIYPGDWDFVIRGIYHAAKRSTDKSIFFFHWRYLEERLRQTSPWLAGHTGWYVVEISNPDHAAAIAQTIDRRFKNSLAETRTETEQAFVMGFISMSEAILIALRIISVVIIGVILAVLSNTMAMTARERLSEYAVLKTLGFGAPRLVFLIAGESLLIGMLGGILGTWLINPAIQAFGAVMTRVAGAVFPMTGISMTTMTSCLLLALGVGLASALFPAWRAVHVSIVDGLRRIG